MNEKKGVFVRNKGIFDSVFANYKFDDIYKEIAISLILIFLVNCSENTNETDIEPSWKLVEELDYANKIILNSYVTTDSMYYYLSTHRGFWEYEQGDLEPDLRYNYGNAITQTLEYKPVISDSISAYLSEDKTEIRLGLNRSQYDVILEIISVWDIDSTFSDNARFAMSYFRNPVGAFNDNNQFLTVVESGSGQSFCLINYSFDDSYSGIKINQLQNIYSFSPHFIYKNILSFSSNFFIALNTAPYMVYPSGETKEIEDIPWSCLEFFTYKNDLYGYTSNFEIYVTYDSGENWEFYAHISAWVSFFEVSGRLCCHRHDDIHEVDFVNEEVRELDNWGLEGNEITSINEFNGRVYISTLSGLFYRDIDEFFTYKDAEEKSSIELEKIK
ncbi:MAG: hypothetical protein KGY74_09090 [Candidatus Cloacimonetes bacterium]|nr:hypothetical protein [Candidatus Cloacimonadota bacterium]